MREPLHELAKRLNHTHKEVSYHQLLSKTWYNKTPVFAVASIECGAESDVRPVVARSVQVRVTRCADYLNTWVIRRRSVSLTWQHRDMLRCSHFPTCCAKQLTLVLHRLYLSLDMTT